MPPLPPPRSALFRDPKPILPRRLLQFIAATTFSTHFCLSTENPEQRLTNQNQATYIKPTSTSPRLRKGSELGVGRLVPDTSFHDFNGESHSLAEFRTHKGLAIAFTSATCPVSKRYLPTLTSLSKSLKEKDIPLLLVNPFPSETKSLIESQIAQLNPSSLYIRDLEGKLSAALDARTTTEVFLLDASGTLVYRGAIDDQYGTNYNRQAPSNHYLQEAVEALLRGMPPKINATEAPGCELEPKAPPPQKATQEKSPPLTYHRDIARILHHNCVPCHHHGGVAPFPLDDLDSVQDRARTIRRVVSDGTMPPWHAAPPAPNSESPWANDCSLSSRDKTDLLTWLNSPERPIGNPADAPLPRRFVDSWTIGTPDCVIPLSRPYEIKASGTMPYQVDIVETDFPEDRWVSAYEVIPTAAEVVHHVILQVHEKGKPAKVTRAAETFWGIYAPGNGAHIYPEGVARKIPAGAKITFQIHYTPSGKATTDRMKLGLVFAKKPPELEVKTAGIANQKLRIPPMASDHVETKSRITPSHLLVSGLMAHMHTRGKAFKYEIRKPGGSTETLLDIPRYDFNWQRTYEFKTPLFLPKGTEVTITAIFDNSPGNKANPDPQKTVTWGEQTSDEMMIGYLEFLTPVSPQPTSSQ